MADPIILVFVHGWSVTSKDTYGDLPEAISQAATNAGLQLETKHIYLGRYISFHDEVTLDDIARAMDHAIQTDLDGAQQFSCITHSTGGPLVRRWVDMYYGNANLEQCPLRHLIMLAPANHGSALAAIGKGRLGRIKSWFGGVEPGQGILDWLSLGSSEAWQLQDSFTDYRLDGRNFYPFVMSGETIDKSFYDFLNAYLVEKGSDGVVRLAGANLNYSFFRLEQTDARYDEGNGNYVLSAIPKQKARSPKTPFGVIPKASHSGTEIGIMRSVKPRNAINKPVVAEIVKCLQVNSSDDYENRIDDLISLTVTTQTANAAQYNNQVRRFVMFIFRVRDNEDRVISDYDLLLLGDGFQPDQLPKGFYVDHQKNPKSSSLTYYLDYDVLSKAADLGIRINPRPLFGLPGKTPEIFAGYLPSEFRFTGKQFSQLVQPNETIYVDIVLKRNVDQESMRFDPFDQGKGSFKNTKPQGMLP
jgi:hypothetical protein